MAKIHKFNWVNIGRQQKSQKIMKYFWQKYQQVEKFGLHKSIFKETATCIVTKNVSF